MPFIAKSELARRAASQATPGAIPTDQSTTAAAKEAVIDTTQTPPPPGENSASSGGQVPAAPAPKQRRGHAVKGDDGKWQPTGDYPEGFARPPEHSRFKPGGKGGPGRPRGSVSHDGILLKHLNQKHGVIINGERQQLRHHELLIASMAKASLDGKDKHARAYMVASSERLFPSKDNASETASASTLNASDALSLAEFKEELRQQLLAELSGERGTDDGGER